MTHNHTSMGISTMSKIAMKVGRAPSPAADALVGLAGPGVHSTTFNWAEQNSNLRHARRIKQDTLPGRLPVPGNQRKRINTRRTLMPVETCHLRIHYRAATAGSGLTATRRVIGGHHAPNREGQNTHHRTTTVTEWNTNL